MKQIIKVMVDIPFEEGEIYTTKFATVEKFTIKKIKVNKQGNITGFDGIYEKCPEIGLCPIGTDRLIPKQIEKEEEIEVCDCCKKPK